MWLWGRRWEVAEKVGCSVPFGSGFTGNTHGNEDPVGIKLELRVRASLEHNLSPPRSWKNQRPEGIFKSSSFLVRFPGEILSRAWLASNSWVPLSRRGAYLVGTPQHLLPAVSASVSLALTGNPVPHFPPAFLAWPFAPS